LVDVYGQAWGWLILLLSELKIMKLGVGRDKPYPVKHVIVE